MSVGDTDDGDDPEASEEYSLYNIRSSRAPMMFVKTKWISNINIRSSHAPMMVTLKLNGSLISMKLDSGAGISIVSEQTHNQLWRGNKRPPLQSSTYTGEKLPVFGVTNVVVEYKQQSEMLRLHVMVPVCFEETGY